MFNQGPLLGPPRNNKQDAKIVQHLKLISTLLYGSADYKYEV